MYFPNFLNRILITWFGCGLMPMAPGTTGSLGALPLCWILSANTSLLFRFFFAVGFTAIATLGSAQDQKNSSTKDPQYIVVDEVAGMLWSTLAIPVAWLPMLVAFVLFRVFDIAKPFPANLFDRKSKTSPTALGRGAYIVLDDVVAGLYSALILQGLVLYAF